MSTNHKLELAVDGVPGDAIPNLARFAHYIGVVTQINGSLIECVHIDGNLSGPETTSADGKVLTLGAAHLPPMVSGKPTAVAAWAGAAVHGFAHSRYSPRTDEPLRATLARRRLHPTWNMIEDARIERLLLRDFPGWTPLLMGAVNHILLKPARRGPSQTLAQVFPLLVGRTYLPADLRQEAFDAFAAEHSDYIAGAVRDLVYRYMMLVDPGSEDHDETIDIVERLRALLGNVGSDCGSSDVSPDTEVEREWTDPGDPSEDDDEGDEADGDEADGDEADGDEADGDGDGDEADGEGDGDEGDEADGEGDGDEGEGDGSDGEGSGDGDESDGEGSGDGDDGEPEGTDASNDGDDDGDESDGEGGTGSLGHGSLTSRLADWREAIDAALEQDERLNDIAEAVRQGPMPQIRLDQRDVELSPVPADVEMAEQDIARELRKLMDGSRPGMRRRIDRGRFNVGRFVREGGMTLPQEMFDRHDPGALRSTGCAVAMLADVSGSMGHGGMSGAMQSVWSIDRAVQSVRGAFKAWTFGYAAEELPSSKADGVWITKELDGSTSPLVGLSAAQAWLSQQREPNKLCIVATDGAWNSMGSCGAVLSSMRQAGVQVAVFGIGIAEHTLRQRFARSGVTVAMIRSAGDLGPAVGEMLVGRVKSALHR